jgi:hypothetical protein
VELRNQTSQRKFGEMLLDRVAKNRKALYIYIYIESDCFERKSTEPFEDEMWLESGEIPGKSENP